MGALGPWTHDAETLDTDLTELAPCLCFWEERQLHTLCPVHAAGHRRGGAVRKRGESSSVLILGEVQGS